MYKRAVNKNQIIFVSLHPGLFGRTLSQVSTQNFVMMGICVRGGSRLKWMEGWMD